MSFQEYEEREGDVCLVPMGEGHFKVYIFDDENETWIFQAPISKEEADRFVRPMQFMGKSSGQREYYRPLA